ncbi:Uncharacterised protein [Mycobacteroides abscessus subsp. abscessus]|nr:Uncharacterised protein [Mycobacteroides abscessus subsp. abscessus]
MTIASVSPTLRARACCPRGNLLASIEMKTTLSIPNTTSSTNSVRNTATRSGVSDRVKSTRA